MLNHEGIFFEGETLDLIHSLEKEQLPIVGDEIHCTFRYHPSSDEIFNNLVGKEMEVLLIGYGSNGQNSGFQIMLPEELVPYYINYLDEDKKELRLPHITASLAEGAKASNTKDLHFKRLERPIPIRGRFGFWIKEEGKEYLSFEPYDVTKQNELLK